MLFLLSELDSRLLATEIADTPLFGTTLTLQSPHSESIENHRFELGRPSAKAIQFGDDEPSPLFTAQPEANPDASEWDYLWRNASRIPITSIPEPTSGSLLIGGAILLCLRMRKISK